MRSISRAETGFTLIEVLLVSVLIGLMAVIIFATWNSVARAKQAIDNERQSIRAAQYVITRITKELAGYATESLTTGDEGGSQSTGTLGESAGLAGATPLGTPAVSYLLGTDKTADRGSADSLRFISSTAGQAQLGTFANFGLVEIEYRLEKPKGEFGSALEANDEYVLVREETPAAVDNKDLREKKKFVFPLAEHVTSLNFRYFDGALWKDAWGEGIHNVPEAIEISLSLKTPTGATATYRTAIGLFRREPGT